jgi:hypothetical protein
VDVTEMGNVTYLNLPKSLRKHVLPHDANLAISAEIIRAYDETPYIVKGVNIEPVNTLKHPQMNHIISP